MKHYETLAEAKKDQKLGEVIFKADYSCTGTTGNSFTDGIHYVIPDNDELSECLSDSDYEEVTNDN